MINFKKWRDNNIIYKKISENNFWILYILLILLFAGDTLTGVFIKKNYGFSWSFKFVISIILFLWIKCHNRPLLIKLCILMIIVYIGIYFNYLNDLIPKTSLFFEYISGILFLNFLLDINFRKKKLEKLILLIFCFYTSTIIIAALFDIEFLKTYGKNRFGYKPIFSSQNEFSYIMISIIAFFYKRYLNKKIFVNFILLFISVIASGLLGTKVVYIFLIIFMNYLLLRFIKIKYYFILVSLTVMLFYFLRNELLKFTQNHFGVLVEVYSKNGFFDAISSLRLSYLEERIICQKSSFNFVNYLFGGLKIECMTEMSLIDIILFFGIVGTIIYFALLKTEIYNKLILDSFGKVLIFSVLILSFLGGYFFENMTAQIYFVLVLFLFFKKK